MKNSVNTNHKLDQIFELEYLRNNLAKNGKLSQLIKTYSMKDLEIINTNTGRKWDILNKVIDRSKNPMAFDRVKCLSRYILGNNLKILDFGFGQGALENVLYENSKISNLIGVDMSPKSVIRAKSKFRKWKFTTGGIEKIKRYKNYFDYVISTEVLEHIPPSKILNTLKQFYISLKTKGYLLISIPLNEGLEELLRNGKNPNSHTRIYTPAIIKSELKITGFKYFASECLFAFKKHYFLKKYIARMFGNILFKPNVMIVLSQKP